MTKLKSDMPKDLTDMEAVRYIYLELGKRLTYNKHVAFGNHKTIRTVYKKSQQVESNMDKILESFESNETACLEISYLLSHFLEYAITHVINEQNIKCEVMRIPQDTRRFDHWYNIITLENGNRYAIDLTRDLARIQSGISTNGFGERDLFANSHLADIEIRKMDRKLGYAHNIPLITRTEYFPYDYASDYFNPMKLALGGVENPFDKIDFVFRYGNTYADTRKMKISEITEYYLGILKNFSIEMKRTNGRYKIGDENEYLSSLSFSHENTNCYYIYSDDRTNNVIPSEVVSRLIQSPGTFVQVSPQELIQMEQNGLTLSKRIGLHRYRSQTGEER
ncbi:MAG: hypothetical protein FWC68_04565 [Oscillospiraceae bacterium]|nr:hypothetical protein [Oscillospiraceae bacterium]